MPSIYSKNHDLFIEKFLNALDLRVLNREKMFFGKNKMNYIFKIQTKIKVFYFVINQSFFLYD